MLGPHLLLISSVLMLTGCTGPLPSEGSIPVTNIPSVAATPEIDIEATVEAKVDKRVAEIFEQLLKGPTVAPPSPRPSFEQWRIDVTSNGSGCSANPADINATLHQRVRFAIQLVSGSVPQTVIYSIPELEMSKSGVAFSPGVTSFELHLTSGNRSSYDFDVANAGLFDILCDGKKIGIFTSR